MRSRIIAGAMVAMQITDWRAERPIVWLLIAMVVTLVADLLWVNAELRGAYVIGGASDVGLFRVLPVHVRAPCASSSGTASRRSTRSGCRAICAARCPSSRSWSAPSRCSTTGCSSPTASHRC